MARPRTKQKKDHDYDRNPKRYLWSLSFDQLERHYPDTYIDLIIRKKEYHRQYYAKYKASFNMKRKYNIVIKELESLF